MVYRDLIVVRSNFDILPDRNLICKGILQPVTIFFSPTQEYAPFLKSIFGFSQDKNFTNGRIF